MSASVEYLLGLLGGLKRDMARLESAVASCAAGPETATVHAEELKLRLEEAESTNARLAVELSNERRWRERDVNAWKDYYSACRRHVAKLEEKRTVTMDWFYELRDAFLYAKGTSYVRGVELAVAKAMLHEQGVDVEEKT